MGLKLKDLTKREVFLSLNWTEDLKQAKKRWVSIGTVYNWLTDAFTGVLHG